ncbi:hypothetical protein CA11_28280 [Gimesia maris]|uniref:hypothetical protein n=1 Tax=Gimesia maris TaxID=122 RepID=UPI001187A445|nr:hypothetical protein [Gimesia maris]QDU15015.1 hypothetical protein CA11_28280 [Gimesia maris]
MNEIISEQSYRPGPWYRSLFSRYAVLTLAISVYLINQVYTRGGSLTDGSAIAALVFMVGGIIMITAGLWAFLTYSRWVLLTLSEKTITKMEGPKEYVISLDQLAHLNWLSISDEMIVESPTDTFRINLDDFKRTDQHAIIAFLRNAVPLEQQEKWEPFLEVRRRSIDPDAALTTGERLLILFCLIATGLAGAMWWNESGPFYLLVGILFLSGAIRSYRWI